MRSQDPVVLCRKVMTRQLLDNMDYRLAYKIANTLLSTVRTGDSFTKWLSYHYPNTVNDSHFLGSNVRNITLVSDNKEVVSK